MSALPPGPDDLFEDDGGPGAGPNPLMIVHRALRGRYLIAAALGLVLAIPLGIAGYFVMPPEFTSRAVLEANLTVPAVLYDDEVKESASAFEAFVSQQASMILSERVLNRAVDDERLRTVGWPAGSAGLIRMRDSVAVTTPKRANLIVVTASDQSPAAAQVAAQAVLKSYREIRDETERRMYGDKQFDLERLREEYLRERDEKRKTALDRAINVAGTEDLQQAQRNTMRELAIIDEQVRELTTLLSMSPDGVVRDPAFEIDDPELERLKDERNLLQRQLDALLLNATPQHRQAKQMTRSIEVLDNAIEAREDELAGKVTPDSELVASNEGRSQMEARLEDLKREHELKRSLLERIARARMDVFGLQQEAEIANDRLEDAERRLEALRVEKESQISLRIREMQEPERPLQPSTDRRLAIAGAGFVGGFGFGIVAVTAFGVAFPRVRVADDVTAARGDFAMLGMIPEFPSAESNGAAMSVREAFQFLRVILDARSGRRCLVCGITSPTAGDGKTTIATRLARSYAATRRRVLLIDADLVGRGSTRELRITPIAQLDGSSSLSDVVVHVEDGFDAIPASDDEQASEVFCGRVLGDILDAARQQYDVIIVDTGPILGSIEAAAMTSSMDQMLLIVSRGMESRLLKMATDRLRELNARSVGIVFNRATTIDFNRSFAPPSSTSRRSVRPGMTGASPAEAREIVDGSASPAQPDDTSGTRDTPA